MNPERLTKKELLAGINIGRNEIERNREELKIQHNLISHLSSQLAFANQYTSELNELLDSTRKQAEHNCDLVMKAFELLSLVIQSDVKKEEDVRIFRSRIRELFSDHCFCWSCDRFVCECEND